ncbi:MAG: hypothetical protein JSR17_01670 [Proteobacteria bacterium]|nr:hypothetical protein [Pseudomonadota bacterium]
MLDGLALPIICAAKPQPFVDGFACLKQIMLHPFLNEEEKYLWLWLATQSTNNMSLTCSLSYEQISEKTFKSSSKVHRLLTRLRTMGFLIADIPIHYGKLTSDMVKTVRSIQLILPPKNFCKPVYSTLTVKPLLAIIKNKEIS